MKHVKRHIDEYLKDQLPGEEMEKVALHMEGCAECREYADWIGELNRAVSRSRMEPPAELVERFEGDLLNLPLKLVSGEIKARPAGRSAERTTALPAWLGYPAPLLKVAALILIGIVIGYGFREGITRKEAGVGTGEPVQAPRLTQTISETPETQTVSAVSHLEARVEELQRALLTTYFAKVEAVVMHFVTSAAEGDLPPLSVKTTQNMLSLTANLKADCKTIRDNRMVRLFAQIELVLMEIDQISRERDLKGARYVAAVIEEEGLLSTLQRLKVGLEE